MKEVLERIEVGPSHHEDVREDVLEHTLEVLPMRVPETRKAEAVRNALEGPLSEQCPGSLVVTHPGAAIYLDRESAALLNTLPVSAS